MIELFKYFMPIKQKRYTIEFSLAFPVKEGLVITEPCVYVVTILASSPKDAERKLLKYAKSKLQLSVTVSK